MHQSARHLSGVLRNVWKKGALARQDTPTAGDFWIAAVATVTEVAGFLLNGYGGDPRGPLMILYIVLGYSILPWRHRAPLSVFAILVVHQSLVFIYSIQTGFAPDYAPWVGVLIALAAVASDRHPAYSISAAAIPYIAWFVILGMSQVPDAQSSMLFAAALVGAAWIVGRISGFNRHRIRLLQEEKQETAQALAAERTLIAAELHDIVSHAVTVMTLHAAGGRRIFEKDPQRAAATLELIETVGSQTVDELRRLLEVLRTTEGWFDADSLEPLARFDDIERLVVPVRAAGIPVQMHTAGEPQQLADSVSHTAYRVVQEALTNVTKHSGPGSSVFIRIQWTANSLLLDVDDDGGGTPPIKSPASLGFGLLGLQERVIVAGGTLSHGRDGKGFHVHAELPAGALKSSTPFPPSSLP